MKLGRRTTIVDNFENRLYRLGHHLHVHIDRQRFGWMEFSLAHFVSDELRIVFDDL